MSGMYGMHTYHIDSIVVETEAHRACVFHSYRAK